jgi:purine-nucleoside phosphorylase
MNLLEKLRETVDWLKKEAGFSPQYGIILGTGLGNLASEIEVHKAIDYHNIPNFPVATVKGHAGKLIFGTIAGKKVVAMAGRFHFYEGYSMQEVTFPVRVMKLLGIETLFIGSAVGGLNQHVHVGDLVIVRDHINLMPEHPLRGLNHEELGPRFPDMLHTYNQELVKKGLEVARKNSIRCHSGVYVGVQGPSLETPAEYKFMHVIGGDVVGMSTVPEAIVAKHMELKVFAITVCSDMGYPPEAIQVTTHDMVIAEAKAAEPRMTIIITEILKSL